MLKILLESGCMDQGMVILKLIDNNIVFILCQLLRAELDPNNSVKLS